MRAALTRRRKRHTAGMSRKKQLKKVSSEHMDFYTAALSRYLV